MVYSWIRTQVRSCFERELLALTLFGTGHRNIDIDIRIHATARGYPWEASAMRINVWEHPLW